MKSLSVLMSIFNETETQIKESVSSVLSQGYKDLELIIILDRPEREAEIRNLISELDDGRIIFDKNEHNIGLALSMNKAARLAQAKVFARMDADDISLPGRFQREMEIINTGLYDLVFSNYNTFDDVSNTVNVIDVEGDSVDPVSLWKEVSLWPNIIHHPTVMFTRAIFEQVGGYRDFPCSQDSDLWLRMAETGCRFYKIGDPLLNYRVNPKSITNSRWVLQQLTCHYIFELSVQRLNKGVDTYSYDNYQFYLSRWGVNDESVRDQLRKSTDVLAQAKELKKGGHRILALLQRTRVFLTSKIYRRHYCFYLKKLYLLHK